MKKIAGLLFVVLGLLTTDALAAVCTSKSWSRWSDPNTWDCGRVPQSTDTVVLAHGVSNIPNTTVAGLTINNGIAVNTGNDITVTGNVVNNGFLSGGGRIIMTSANTTVSGTGMFTDSRLYVDATGVTLTAGSNLSFNGDAQIRVGRNAPGTLTVEGTITGTGMNVGGRLLRVYNASTLTLNGTVLTYSAYAEVQTGGTLINNGTTTLHHLVGAGTLTQGANANLTLQATSSWTGVLDATANNNTVTYNGTAAPITPKSNTYFNLAGPGVTCPHNFTILGSSPCGPTVSIALAGTSPTNATTVSWTLTFSEAVTGVTLGDFTLAATGVTGATVTTLTGSGTTWTVTANTGTGNGSLGLNLVDHDTIKGPTNMPLGGWGWTTITGPIYNIDRTLGTINTYYPGTASVAKGATSLTLGTAIGATTPIAAGDLVLIMQMQDGAIDATNTAAYGDGVTGDPGQGSSVIGGSGLYEYAVANNAVGLAGGTLTLRCASGTLNAYTHANATASQGQRRFQVIRVPVYANLTLSAATATAWNGSTGGVLAFDVTGTLDLGGMAINVDGKGFRGGAGRRSMAGSGAFTDYVTPFLNGANGSKGEGIAGTPQLVIDLLGVQLNTGLDGYPSGSFARGAPGNAGGGGTDLNPPANDQNSGGGGGGNGGSGGIGGIGWCPGFTATAPWYGCGKSALYLAGTNPNGSTGGFGGAAVALNAGRLTLGGGGGAATTNNGTGANGALSSSGAPGGGMILVRAGSITGTGTFSANGANGDNSVGNDGSGGGGGGGVVLVSAGSGTGGLTINVRGGIGGSNLLPATGFRSTPHGPGGGGGGGYAIVSGAPAACDANGGAAGNTYNNGALFGNYGAMGGGSGSCNTTLTTQQVVGAPLGGGSACSVLLDHFTINVGGSPASTCAPRTVGITVQDAANATYTNYTGTVTITTSSGHGDWSINTANGSLNNGAADDGVASYTFVASDNGSIQLDLSNSHADTLVVTVSDAASAVASSSAAIRFADNVFVITPTSCTGSGCATTPVTPSEELVAGRPHAMQAALWTKDATTGNCALNTRYSGDVSLKAWIGRDATNDPSGAAPTLSSTIPGVTAIALPNTTPATSNTQLRFANGVAPFSLGTNDVGKYSVQLLDSTGGFAVDATTATATPIQGSSNLLTVRPFALALRSVTNAAGGANPGSTDVSLPVFTCAGCNFNATVAAVQWESADDTNNDGLPNSAANLSDNAVTTAYKWPGAITAAAPVTPVGGTVGAVTGTFVATDFNNGVAALTTVNYAEVGSITLQAQADPNYLGTTGVAASTGTGLVVGRFTPDHFDVQVNTPTFAPGCGSFTYLAQSFTYATAPQVTVTARNAAGGKTDNYTGNWWRLAAPATFTLSNDTTKPALPDNVAFAGTTVASAFNCTACNGTATTTLNGNYNFARTAANIVPFTPAPVISFAIEDADAVTTATSPFTMGVSFPAGSDQVRSGRAYAQDVYGTIGNTGDQLSMPVVAQYFDGTSWVNNVSDTCSAAPTLPPSVKVDTHIQTTATPSGTFVAGVGSILFKVTGGTPGNSKITFDWTAQPWFGPIGTPPTAMSTTSATATFGVYRGDRRIIHWQEL